MEADLIGLLKQAEDEAKDQLDRAQAARRALEGRERPGRKPVSAQPKAKDRPRPRIEDSKPPKRATTKDGKRAEQALALVTVNPEITAKEIAEQMKIRPNYVYRVMGGLLKDKKVKKKGRRYTALA